VSKSWANICDQTQHLKKNDENMEIDKINQMFYASY